MKIHVERGFIGKRILDNGKDGFTLGCVTTFSRGTSKLTNSDIEEIKRNSTLSTDESFILGYEGLGYITGEYGESNKVLASVFVTKKETFFIEDFTDREVWVIGDDIVQVNGKEFAVFELDGINLKLKPIEVPDESSLAITDRMPRYGKMYEIGRLREDHYWAIYNPSGISKIVRCLTYSGRTNQVNLYSINYNKLEDCEEIIEEFESVLKGEIELDELNKLESEVLS